MQIIAAFPNCKVGVKNVVATSATIMHCGQNRELCRQNCDFDARNNTNRCDLPIDVATFRKKKNVSYWVTDFFKYKMPSTMSPTVPRKNVNIIGRLWKNDIYLSEAAVKARLLAYQPQLEKKT